VAENGGVGVDQVGGVGDLLQALGPSIRRVRATKDLTSLFETRTVYRMINFVT